MKRSEAEAIQEALNDQKKKDEARLGKPSQQEYAKMLASEPVRFVYSVLDSCLRSTH